ncbi:MAG: tRNA lysidine(34) synthetase TilS [Candidatus Omnitrophica bacterium]|nr:tRNA lysidine(34) synthetase TilS [Candidatus Omnitrophota bacterium]
MDAWISRFERTLDRQGLLGRGRSMVAAVSGGLDSMVLLHVLHQLAGTRQWRLTVAHFNHQLRGAASDGDEQLVRDTARAMGLEFEAGRADVRRFQEQEGLSLEMAARKLRHDFLAEVARRYKAGSIVLAHHADDQVELFFLRLLRGTVGAGLAGMKWAAPSPSDPSIQLGRPLLDQPKAALLAYAGQWAIPYREDASNAHLNPMRNRLRHELLPLLREKYQPALDRVVLRLIGAVGDETGFAQTAAREWLEGKPRVRFEQLPPAVQRYGLVLQLHDLGMPPHFDLVEQLRREPSKPAMIGPGILVSRNAAGEVCRRLAKAGEFCVNKVFLDLEGENADIQFDQMLICWKICACASAGNGAVTTCVKKSGGAPAAGRPFVPVLSGQEHFDAGKVGRFITLRHWLPGDRFQPIGMPAPVKLQDLFTNRRIPREWRRQLVVGVVEKGDIFWVEGLRIADGFKLDSRTRNCLSWQWQRTESKIACQRRTC